MFKKPKWSGLILFLCLFISVDCNAKEKDQLITFDALRAGMKFGEVISLSQFFNANEKIEKVCILYPYQDSFIVKDQDDQRANKYLKSAKYLGDESHWAFVFLSSVKVSLSRFNRSEKLDILAPHEVLNRKDFKMPNGLNPVVCSSIVKAKLIIVRAHNRNYIIMGESK